MAYKAYSINLKQEKKQAKQLKRDKSSDDSSVITMKDDKIVSNGIEYTPEEFSKLNNGIKFK
jgi:hypothetical protein